MDIKPPTIPSSLPISDTQRLDSTSRQIDSEARAQFSSEFSSAAAVAPETIRQAPVDAGEPRIGGDPWTSAGTTSQRLLLTGISPNANLGSVAEQSLPDAVRSAVDFVFADLT